MYRHIPECLSASREERSDQSGEPDRRALDWLASSDRQNIYYYTQDVEDARGDVLSNVGCFLDEENDLKRYILSQFMGTDLEPEVMRGVEFLVDRLDSNGFLDEIPENLAREAGLPVPVIRRALVELQAADPAGAGARNLSECLQLQIERRAGDHQLAVRIVEKGLDHLARGQYAVICRELGGSEKDVREACNLIRSLNPRPSTGFAARENLVYLTPDVTVTAAQDQFELHLNDSALPHLRLSAYYSALMQDTGDPEVRQYLSEKVDQAKWVVKSLDQRRSTLLRCSQWVVEHQKEFFRSGSGHLRPITMSDAARDLDLHESTVSRALKVAPMNATVLLLGDTGVGKEEFAHLIYENSSRADQSFIGVNCGAIPPALIESELFGYERGAFTGASREGKKGVFESADKGTVFLDEIGELPLNMQVHLLRILQNMEITRVGGVRPIPVDVRIIAATNRDLQQMVQEKTFREDLYHRLNVVPITVSPLRERKQDIAPLALSFLRELNKKYQGQKYFSPTAMEALNNYLWPGNVRELKNVVEQAVILSPQNEIFPMDLPIYSKLESKDAEQTGSANEAKDLKTELARVEYGHICRAYAKHGTVRTAAASLGMNDSTFVRKRQKYKRMFEPE